MMKRFAFVLIFASLMWACDGGGGSPIATAPTPAGAGPTYTLSGVVATMTSAGVTPVGGVQVRESNFGYQTTTDANGFYSISGLHAMSNSVTASKAGYETDTQVLRITGDTQLDIRLTLVTLYTRSYTLSGV